ncbi:MAG TPA: hypothetical protein VKT72_18075 [Candidatus Baltobacteraceae bacterium]|nr:hypothetical protein [Candidatus Baltobacteraceae bacterium]
MERSSKRIWTIAALNFVLLLMLVLVEWNVFHVGTFGLTFDPTQGTVFDLQDGQPAALAGITEGDRIDLSAIASAEQRRILLDPRIGESVRLLVLHDGARRTVLLTAVKPESALRRTIDAIGFPILVVISVGLSSLLVLVRPQPATWAFYVYALLMAVKSFEGNLVVRPVIGTAVIQTLFELAWSAAVVSLLFFATRIFAWSRPWRKYVEGAAIVVGFVDAFVWFYPNLSLLFAWNSMGPWALLQRIFDFALLSLILCALAVIAVSSKPERRQHTIWVLAGISLVPLLEWIDAVVYLCLYSQPSLHSAAVVTDAVDAALRPWLPILAALAVYYALVHERVVDIRFAIGRAAEYALTTAVVIVAFAILEWAFGQLFEGSRGAAYASLIAAVIVGFSFNAVHDRVDRFIEAIFFFKERDARERLLRVSRALLYANSERLVVEFLLDHPIDALELTSGAIFIANEAGTGFRRIAASNWEYASLTEIAIDDALVAQLRAVQDPLDLRSAGWNPQGLPTGEGTPTLAVQILMRAEVYAVALYGRHVSGAEISRDEQELLHSVAANAAAAFDHLDAERARREIEALRSENAALHKLSAT